MLCVFLTLLVALAANRTAQAGHNGVVMRERGRKSLGTSGSKVRFMPGCACCSGFGTLIQYQQKIRDESCFCWKPLDRIDEGEYTFLTEPVQLGCFVAVTIKQVAERAGVSKAAVSYVLNGHAEKAKIPPETAQRILAVAREMQYRPNALARGLAGKRTEAIRVVLQYAEWFSVWSGFTSEMMRGVAAAAYREDLEIVLHTRRSAQGTTEGELANILDGRTDGAVLLRSYNDPLLEQLTERGFPFVLMFSRTQDERIRSVDCDNVRGGRLATDYLLDLGHRRILHVAGGHENSSPGVERRQGFEEAMRARGLSPRPDWIIEAWQQSKDATLTPVVAALRLPPQERPTAVFAWYDGMAVRLMEIARDLGLRIPEDVSLIGFDGTDMGAYTSPPLTTVWQPVEQIAAEAVTLLARQLRGEEAAEHETLFAPKLIVRGSCAAV